MTVIKSKKVDIELENKNGEIVGDTFNVRRLRFDKLTAALEEVHSVYDLIMDDENLRTVFEEVFGEDDITDPNILDNFTEEEKNQVFEQKRAAAEKRFLKGLMGSFPLLLLHLPKKAGDLLSVMAQIDRNVLGQQELETVMDLYDAVLLVNDIEMLMDRAKKSLDVTKQATAFLNLVRKATGQIKI